jgi:hypothetical protein
VIVVHGKFLAQVTGSEGYSKICFKLSASVDHVDKEYEPHISFHPANPFPSILQINTGRALTIGTISLAFRDVTMDRN